MYTFFILIQYISIVLLVIEAFYVIRHKYSKQQQYLIFLIFALGINTIGYLLELQSATQREALLTVKFSYIGKPYIAFNQFLLVMQICKVKLPKNLVNGLFFFHTAIVFLVLTCEHHSLYYTSIQFTEDGIFPHLVLKHSIIYNLNILLLTAYAIFMTAICISRCRQTQRASERATFLYLIIINVVSISAFLIYLSGITQGYDITLLAYFIDSLLLSQLIFREKIFQTLALAKDLAVDSLAEGLVVVDNEDDIIYFNRKAEEIYDNIAIGKSDAILEDLDSHILDKKNMFQNRRVYSVSSNLLEQGNDYYGKIYVLSDITEGYYHTQSIKEQAKIMKELKEQAESANQTKSVFLSNMSHEIRTPMNAIIGLTDVLLRKELSMEEKRYLLNIKSSGNALLKLINDLLDFSKIEAGKYEISKDTYDIAQMLRDIQMIGITRIGDKGVELIMDIDENIPRLLYGDALRIRQVIINIMNNAIKFTEEGSVTVSVRQQIRNEKKVQLTFSVKDTGQGIREQDIHSLFDAFTQVDLKKNKGKEGTGLGLAISRQLVELMGGELTVTSEYGKGSDFHFTLWETIENEDPIGDFSEIQDPSEEDAEEDIFTFTLPKARILLVDDNEVNQCVAVALMEPFEMQIDIANNGQEALDMVQKTAYDLVFMDHFMPIMDGVEATQRIRALDDESFRKLPIIALTADAVQGIMEKLLAAGMNDFASKPIDMKEIAALLQRWIPEEKICKKTS